VIVDEKTGKAIDIQWEKNKRANKKAVESGCYCLRSSLVCWSVEKLWRTYTMLTEVEACFRSLKSELGLRPVYHQITARVTAHLFITLMAYHLVHTFRHPLKQKGIYLSWESLRNVMANQHRMTLSMNTKEYEKLHLRVMTKASTDQQRIFNALGIKSDILGKKKVKTNKSKIFSANFTG